MCQCDLHLNISNLLVLTDVSIMILLLSRMIPGKTKHSNPLLVGKLHKFPVGYKSVMATAQGQVLDNQLGHHM